MISPQTIQEILEASKIEEVLQDYIDLKRRGANFTGLCPFHNEKTPSFSVSPAKGIYKCFGCGRAGNVIGFVMEHESMSYPDALRMLAGKYNIAIEEELKSEEYSKAEEHRESLMVLNNAALKYYQNYLNSEDKIGKLYFKERGFRDAIIEKFQLGFSSEGYSDFTDLALSKGYKKELLLEAGLTKEKENKRYDFFRARAIFPIHNLSGKVIAFAGRILKSNTKAPKYLNSPETPLYHKSKILYAFNFARHTIRTEDECILVEGYTDTISLHQAGIENVVASSGTSLTPEQVQLVKRFTENLTIIYDGDSAGLKAALRGLDIVVENGLNVRLVVLPEGEDPDSYLQKVGKEEFVKYLKEEKKDFVLFKTDLLLKEHGNDPIGRTTVLKSLVETLALIKDPIKRNAYAQECCRKMEFDEATLINEVNKVIRKNLSKNRPSNQPYKEEIAPPQDIKVEKEKEIQPDETERQEKKIIALLMEYGSQPYDEEHNIAEAIFSVLDGLDIQNINLREICMIYKEEMEKGNFPDFKFFSNHSKIEVANYVMSTLEDEYNLSPNWKEKYFIPVKTPQDLYVSDVKMSLGRLQFKFIMKELKKVQEKLKQEKDEGVQMQLLKYRMKLMEDQKLLLQEWKTVVVK